jgi:hypothetical protein
MKKIILLIAIATGLITGCSKSDNISTVKPGQHIEYYRIKQVDNDGKVSYSRIVSIVVDDAAQ